MRITQIGSNTQAGNGSQVEVCSHRAQRAIAKQQSFVSSPFRKATEDNICASLAWSD